MIILVVLLLCELTVAYFTFSYLNVVLFVWGDGVYVCGFGFASEMSQPYQSLNIDCCYYNSLDPFSRCIL